MAATVDGLRAGSIYSLRHSRRGRDRRSRRWRFGGRGRRFRGRRGNRGCCCCGCCGWWWLLWSLLSWSGCVVGRSGGGGRPGRRRPGGRGSAGGGRGCRRSPIAVVVTEESGRVVEFVVVQDARQVIGRLVVFDEIRPVADEAGAERSVPAVESVTVAAPTVCSIETPPTTTTMRVGDLGCGGFGVCGGASAMLDTADDRPAANRGSAPTATPPPWRPRGLDPRAAHADADGAVIRRAADSDWTWLPARWSSPRSADKETYAMADTNDRCGRGDLNPHTLRYQILSLARLPFRHVRWRRRLYRSEPSASPRYVSGRDTNHRFECPPTGGMDAKGNGL